MTKLDQARYREYWSGVHRNEASDLAAVCFPEKPAYFNQFFDRSQRFAMARYFALREMEIRGKHALDIGCGRGRWLRWFGERGATATGIDFSTDAVAACVAAGLDARHASAAHLPFADRSFDLVTSITVLLHLPYDLKDRAVAEIARVLRPGGTALLLESTWADDPSPHVYGLTIAEWRDLFAAHGLQLGYREAHYFNLMRRHLPGRIPSRDRLAIYLDYPVEFGLMRLLRGRESALGLQHLMEFSLATGNDDR